MQYTAKKYTAMIQDISRMTFVAMTLSPVAPTFFTACDDLLVAIETPAAFASLIKKYAYDACEDAKPQDDPRSNNFRSIVAINALQYVDWVYLADLYWHDFKLGRMAQYAPMTWQLTKPVEPSPAGAKTPTLDWSHVDNFTPQ